MQQVLLTIDNSKNAHSFLNLIKEFDFVRSVEFNDNKIDKDSENEIFTEDWSNDFFLEDLQMTVKEFREQTLQDEKEQGMTKSDFFKSMAEWRAAKEK